MLTSGSGVGRSLSTAAGETVSHVIAVTVDDTVAASQSADLPRGYGMPATRSSKTHHQTKNNDTRTTETANYTTLIRPFSESSE